MKLAEMNGFPGLLQSTLSIPEEENMFLWSSSSNVESVFMNWKHDGNCFEEVPPDGLPAFKPVQE